MIYDALILGGGPSGSVTAHLLARAGWSVALVEKSEFPRRKVCGEFISATSLPLLAGLGDDFRAQAGPDIRRVALFAGDTTLISSMPHAARSSGLWGRALGREHLDVLLLNRAVASGAHLFQPWKAMTVRRENGVEICTIASKSKTRDLAARLVISANGSWERSPLAAAAPPHRDSDLLAFKAHFSNADLAPDIMPLLVFPGGYGGMVHSDAGRVSLSCCIRRDVLARARETHPGPAAEAVLRHIQAHCAGAREALKQANREGAFLSAGPIRPGIRARYKDGVFFTGNAAGEAHPIVAEGISMAAQSAWLLAQCLIADREGVLSGAGRDVVGRRYAAQWAHSFAPRIRAASLFAHLAMRPQAATFVLSLLKLFPVLLTLGARLSGKTRQIVPSRLV